MNFEQIINKLAKENLIKVIKDMNGLNGIANHTDKIIHIPKKLDTVPQFMVALHEIGHIINGYKKPTFYAEYLAERYAIDTAQKFGIDPKEYFENAKKYVKGMLAKAWNRGLKLSSVPKEVELFCDIDLEELIAENGPNFKFSWE
jgi:hypothetical protein